MIDNTNVPKNKFIFLKLTHEKTFLPRKAVVI